MANAYVEQLSGLARDLDLESSAGVPVVVKPFFGGAAVYVGGAMVASLSPVGLAFKLGETETAALVASGVAKPLKYFPGGHVKKGYALFEDPDLTSTDRWRGLAASARRQRSGTRRRR